MQKCASKPSVKYNQDYYDMDWGSKGGKVNLKCSKFCKDIYSDFYVENDKLSIHITITRA